MNVHEPRNTSQHHICRKRLQDQIYEKMEYLYESTKKKKKKKKKKKHSLFS